MPTGPSRSPNCATGSACGRGPSSTTTWRKFNYHLTKLVGHFVAKTDTGYVLRRPGKRVADAILAGAVEEGSELEPSTIDYDCHFCGSPVAVWYTDGHFVLTCTECRGHRTTDEELTHDHDVEGYLATVELPPAGVEGRTPMELFRAASTWVHLAGLAVPSGVCPRCSARVEPEVDPCLEHDAEDGICDHCQRRLGLRIRLDCTNCTYEFDGPSLTGLLDAPELLAFAGAHGFNVTSTGIDWGWEWDEAVLSTDPFRCRIDVTIDEETLSLVVDEHLDVVESTRDTITDP